MKELIELKNIKLDDLQVASNMDQLIHSFECEVEKTGVFNEPNSDEGREARKKVGKLIVRTRNILDNMGKERVSVLKQEAKKTDSWRKTFRDKADEIKAEVLKPVVEYENWLDENKNSLNKLNELLVEIVDANNTNVVMNIFELVEPYKEFNWSFENKDKFKELLSKITKAGEQRIDYLKMEAERKEAERKAEIERQAEERAKQMVAEKERQEQEHVKQPVQAEIEPVVETVKQPPVNNDSRAKKIEAMKCFEVNGFDRETAVKLVKMIVDGKIKNIFFGE